MPFQPLHTKNSLGSNFNQVNTMMKQLEKEQTVKTFKQAGGNAIITGKLPYDGGYGSLFYDSTNTPRIVLGILPDGTMGMVISKEGVSVLDVFS